MPLTCIAQNELCPSELKITTYQYIIIKRIYNTMRIVIIFNTKTNTNTCNP